MNLFLANVEEAEMEKVPKSVAASSEWMRDDLSNAANVEGWPIGLANLLGRSIYSATMPASFREAAIDSVGV